MSLIFAPSSFRFVRGTTWSDEFQLVNDLLQPISLVGIANLLMRVRPTSTASSVLDLSMANGRLTVTDAAQGIVSLVVSAIDTLVFPANNHRRKRYMYDAVIDYGGTPKVIRPGMKGKVIVDPQIARLLSEP